MKKSSRIIGMTAVCAALTACSHRTGQVAESLEPVDLVKAPVIGGASRVGMIPKAIVYRIDGPATIDNVPVQVNSAGDIISFPAPGDVVGQEPLQLADGYLLDRRGISADSRFTRWTYAEYAALQASPSLSEIKAAIISGARPADIHILDMTPSEAAADTVAVNRMIKNF